MVPGDSGSSSARKPRDEDVPTGQAYASLGGDEPPKLIGPYQLEVKLGEGGMGIVYRARQSEPIARTVALKIIKPGVGSGELVQRFEAERQALALMNHPSIARIFDAGRFGSLPFFVMEYVEGSPLLEYCALHKLVLKDRLQLFLRICDAVQHAHDRGVIHRDLKPTNILVTQVDGVPHPTIIDFGIAKAVDRALLGDAIVTAAGRVSFTPAYASPEQAEGRVATASTDANDKRDLDARTDIYSLGVVLYEFLTGVRPLGHDKMTLTEFLRTLAEKEPVSPSRRAAALIKSNQAEADPLTLPARQLRGDLDAIILKTLEKKRERRYAFVRDLSLDLKRYLDHQPVQARSERGFIYHSAKFLRRHRVVASTLAALVTIGVLTAWGSSLWARSSAIEQARSKGLQARESFVAYLELQKESNRLRDQWRRARDQNERWRMPWERVEEIEAWNKLKKSKLEQEKAFNVALVSLIGARELAPRGSDIAKLLAREQEDLQMNRVRQAWENGGELSLPVDSFAAEVKALNLETYRDELEGKGRLEIETYPPAEEAFCFRYEEHDACLLPLPFHADRGLVGRPFLRVQKVDASSTAGFRAGDIIRQVQGQTVGLLSELAKVLESVQPGQSVTVVLERERKELSLAWVPSPEESNEAPAGTLRIVPQSNEAELIFDGYPLEFTDSNRLLPSGQGRFSLDLPGGSYLILFRRPGCVDTRLPILLPRDSAGQVTRVRMIAEEQVPPGFVYVSAGNLRRGSSARAYEPVDREDKVACHGFFMSQFEVTFEEYISFLNDLRARGVTQGDRLPGTKLSSPAWSLPELSPLKPTIELPVMIPGLGGQRLLEWDSTLGTYKVFKKSIKNEKGEEQQYAVTKREYPAYGINMIAAAEFAQWRTQRSQSKWTFRLPTHLEWERAARGADGRQHVWGDYLILGFCHSMEGVLGLRGRATFGGSFPLDESVFGIRDLNGSVSEPTLTPTEKKGLNQIVICGGQWNNSADADYFLATRNFIIPWNHYSSQGIRLVVDLPKEE